MLITDSPYTAATIRRQASRITTAASPLLVIFTLCGVLLGVPEVWAEGLQGGPTLQVGYIEDADRHGVDRQLLNLTLGWRFRFEDGEGLSNFFARAGLDLSWVVEPSVGFFEGDRSAFEASVVPMFHFEAANAGEWTPYLEGGIGLMYNDLRGFDLGSRILFSDQGTVGLSWLGEGGHRWSLGYRLRHISHAHFWADANDGLNTHFLVLGYE